MPNVSLTRRASLLLLAPALALPASKAFGQDLPTIRVVGPPNDGMKPVWYAMRSGLFRRYNINVESSTVNNGAAAMAAMVGGSAEVAFTNLLAVFQGYLRNIPIQVVAPSALYLKEKPQSAMVVLKDSPLHTGRDVNGKLFSTPAVRDLNEAVMRAWVDKNGGDSKTMRVIEIPASSSLPALEEGRIDVATIYEPALTQALLTGRVRVLGRQFEAVGDRFQQTAFASLGTYVDRNRDTMSRFARAMHESIVYTNSHLPETVDLVASYTGLAPEVIAKSVRFIDPEYAEVRNIQPMLDICVKYGVLDRGFSADEIISPVAVKPPPRR